jgi:hypothetical protein
MKKLAVVFVMAFAFLFAGISPAYAAPASGNPTTQVVKTKKKAKKHLKRHKKGKKLHKKVKKGKKHAKKHMKKGAKKHHKHVKKLRK